MNDERWIVSTPPEVFSYCGISHLMLWIRVKRLPFRPPSNPAQFRFQLDFPDLRPTGRTIYGAGRTPAFCLGDCVPLLWKLLCGWANLVRVAQNGLRAV
jgi:hypothetical protein